LTPATTLLILRIASAALLLAFLVLIAWFSYQDIKQQTAGAAEKRRSFGWLEVVASEGDILPVGQTFPLRRVTSIGRGAGNTLVLNDDFVSGEHALLTLSGEQWWLEDLNSRNGTFLNGIPLETRAVVTTGDIFTFGGTRIKLVGQVDGQET
jgi:hypothetical protein